MADNPASVGDVESRFRLLTDAERVNAEAWLADAWSILTTHRPNLPDDLDDPAAVSESEVRRVVANMVVRKLQNPDGKLEEAGDDYRFRRDSAVSSGELYASERELEAVTPASEGRTRNSVRLVANRE